MIIPYKKLMRYGKYRAFLEITKNWKLYRKDYLDFYYDRPSSVDRKDRKYMTRVFNWIMDQTRSDLLDKNKIPPRDQIVFAEIHPMYIFDRMQYHKTPMSLRAIKVAINSPYSDKDHAKEIVFEFQKDGGKFIK